MRIVSLACTAAIMSLVIGTSACADTPLYASSRSILNAIGSPDGCPVALTGVWVDKVSVRPSYIVVREPWSADERIIIQSDRALSIERWQTVDSRVS